MIAIINITNVNIIKFPFVIILNYICHLANYKYYYHVLEKLYLSYYEVITWKEYMKLYNSLVI